MPRRLKDPTARWACKRCGCTNEKVCRIYPYRCYWIAGRLCSACMTPNEAHEFAAKGRTVGWDGLAGGVAQLRADAGWQPRRSSTWANLDLDQVLAVLAGARGRKLIEICRQRGGK